MPTPASGRLRSLDVHRLTDGKMFYVLFGNQLDPYVPVPAGTTWRQLFELFSYDRPDGRRQQWHLHPLPGDIVQIARVVVGGPYPSHVGSVDGPWAYSTFWWRDSPTFRSPTAAEFATLQERRETEGLSHEQWKAAYLEMVSQPAIDAAVEE